MLLKAFRLFVSSTFSDFAREREVLQSRVFPALDAYCATRGYQFHAVDLRWGVNHEAQLDQRTAEICLGEVDAAKRYPPPNFLIMVGDWYGWVPLPFAIAQDEFEAATAWLAERGRAEAVRRLCEAYRLDENYLLPTGLNAAADAGRPSWLRRMLGNARRTVTKEPIGAYTLRSREDEMPKLAPADAWREIEDQLRGALQEAADRLWREGRIGETARAKYFLSLTEQEIVEGLKNKAQSASGQRDRGAPQSIAWIREHTGACDPRVERLKAGIRRALPPDCVLAGRPARNVSGQFDASYLEDFAARVESRLRAAIDSHIAVIEAQERSGNGELVRESAQHEAFAEERRSVFYGRESNRAAIASYVASDSAHPLVLSGSSGLGKSALIARAVADAKDSGRGIPVVYRFVGASAASADVRSLLVSIVEDLADRGIAAKPAQWEDDANKFDEQVRTLLMSIDRPAAIFIDALDQLKKPRLGWLPNKLPPRVKIVVSALSDKNYEEDSGICRALRQRLPPEAFLKIELLTEAQGRDIVIALEGRTNRRLRRSQRDYVLSRFETAGASPLWLRVAFEIARGWRSWDEPGTSRCVLAGDTGALIGQLIAELTSVHHHEPEFVSRTLGYLAAAKDGLSAKEMTEVLSADAGVMQVVSRATEKHGVPTPSVERHGEQKPKLPDSVWVRLHRQIAPLLAEKRVDEQPLLAFFHRQLADIARERHYAPAKAALHGALVDYFDVGAATDGKDAVALGRRTYARRSLSELPYQLFHAGRRVRLDEILMGPDWMQQKLAAHGPRPLIDDYQYAHTNAQRLTGQALDLAAGVLARDQRQFVPQILGHLRADLADEPTDAVAIDGLLGEARALVCPPALAPRWSSFAAPGGPEMRRFEGHRGWVWAVAFSPDGRHVVSGSDDRTLRLWEVASGASRMLGGHGGGVRAVAFSPDGRHVVSGGDDRTVRLWEVATGGCSHELGGHGDEVHAVAFSPDGRHVVSGSDGDGTLRLWEVASGTSRMLEGHGGFVRGVAFSPDGRHVVSGSDDQTLRLWEVASGVSRVLEGHRGPVNAVSFSPDGRHVVSGSDDQTLRLWEVASGASRTLEGHRGGVDAVAFSPDGRHVVSGSRDGTLRLWEVASGTSRMLEGHGGFVRAVAFSPDGRHVMSSSSDRTLRLWEVARGASRTLDGHRGGVDAVAFSPNGRHLVSGSREGTLRLWEVASRASRALEGHHGWVRGVAFSPDGRHVVSGSDGDGTLRLWDIAGGESRALDGQGHGGGVWAVAFSPDGRHVVSGSDDQTLRLWEVASGVSRMLGGHRGFVCAVAFSPDGRHVVSGSADGTLHLWEVASGASRKLEGHSHWVWGVAFSPNGRHVISGSGDHTLRLWEVASEAFRVFEGHGDTVNAVAFSPYGRHVVSGSSDCTLRLWEVARGHEIIRLDGDNAFLAIHIAPDGKSLATGDSGGRVHLIDILLDAADKAAWLAPQLG